MKDRAIDSLWRVLLKRFMGAPVPVLDVPFNGVYQKSTLNGSPSSRYRSKYRPGIQGQQECTRRVRQMRKGMIQAG